MAQSPAPEDERRTEVPASREELYAWLRQRVQKLDPNQHLGEPDDIVQDVMVRLCRDWSKVQQRPGNEQVAWLKRTLHSVILDRQRTQSCQKRDPDLEQRLTPEEMEDTAVVRGPTPGSWVAQQDRDERVRQAIEQLPDTIREVVKLRLLSERSTDETAQQLGITRYKVKVSFHLGKKMLRDLLGPILGEDW
jgi:RNA polymerase sigma factor (sigma-70 family)